MAIKQLGKGVSLAGSLVPSGSLAIARIQSYTFSREQELADFLAGDARVNTHYQGRLSAELTVETPDVSALVPLAVGAKLTAVILTVSAAVEAGGVKVGNNATITLSHAVVSEIGEITASNESDAPVVQSITFRLNRIESATTDPTFTIAHVT